MNVTVEINPFDGDRADGAAQIKPRGTDWVEGDKKINPFNGLLAVSPLYDHNPSNLFFLVLHRKV
jgi:hypothetical protein